MIEGITSNNISIESEYLCNLLISKYKKKDFNVGEIDFNISTGFVDISYYRDDEIYVDTSYPVSSLISLVNYLVYLLGELLDVSPDYYDELYNLIADNKDDIATGTRYVDFSLRVDNDSEFSILRYVYENNYLKKIYVSTDDIPDYQNKDYDLDDEELIYSLATDYGINEKIFLDNGSNVDNYKSKLINYLNSLDDKTKAKFSSIITGMAHKRKQINTDDDFAENIYKIMVGMEIPYWDEWEKTDQGRYEYIVWKTDQITKKK